MWLSEYTVQLRQLSLLQAMIFSSHRTDVASCVIAKKKTVLLTVAQSTSLSFTLTEKKDGLLSSYFLSLSADESAQ